MQLWTNMQPTEVMVFINAIGKPFFNKSTANLKLKMKSCLLIFSSFILYNLK